MRSSIFRIGRFQLALLSCLLFAAHAGGLRAATYTGTVRSVSGDVATVAMNGDVVPPNGARAEIFFKIAGGDDEILVATGSALKIDHGDMLVKIEDAPGNIESGQLVRFSSSPSSTPAASSPAATVSPEIATSPATSPMPAGNSSIIGMWMGLEPGGDKVSFTFRASDTVSYVRLQGKKKRVLRGKYRTDCTATPCRVEIFDYEINGVAEKEKTLIGLFEIHEFGFHEFSMKFDLSLELQEHPEKGFRKGVVTLIRAKTDTPSSNDPH